jgi:hypothetical protein
MARPNLLGQKLALLIVAATLASSLTHAAVAQPNLPDAEQVSPEQTEKQLDDDSLKTLIDDLNAQDLQTRDRAQLTLSTTDGIRLDRIEDFLDTAQLSPEQHLRLSAVGFALFGRTPRPAMGVEFGTRFGAVASVTINNTVPGFDAADNLISGDIILRMDGIPVQDFNHARQIILSFDPNDQITVSVLRNGEPVDTLVRFGSFGQLPNPTPPTDGVMREAWNIRRARRAPDRAEPIVTALDSSLRPGDAALAPQVSLQAWRAVEQWLARRLQGDGKNFDTRLGSFLRNEQDDMGPAIQATGAQRMVDAAATEPFNNRPVTPQIAAELRQVDARLSALSREQRVVQQRLLDPNIRADERIRLNNRVRSIQLDMARLREHRRTLIGG